MVPEKKQAEGAQGKSRDEKKNPYGFFFVPFHSWCMMISHLKMQQRNHQDSSIYHNVALRAPLKRAERDSAADTAKRDVFPGVNRKNASGSFSARRIAMHESEWRSVWAHTVPMRHIFGHFQFVNP